MTTEAAPAAIRPPRPWPVKALALLLFLQAAGFAALAVYYYLDGEPLLAAATTLRALVLNSSVRAILFATLALLALVAAVSFQTLWRWGLTLANLVQGASLLAALIQYVQGGRGLTYAVMVSGVLMVVYLNHPEVGPAFSPPVPGEPEGSEE